MAKTIQADICVIGGGSGGLSVAAGASQMGAKVVLLEKGKMGGDCLNYGCVPSKALIAAGHAADTVRHAGKFGVNGHEPEVDFLGVRDHVRGVIAAIAPHDSVERFEELGVTVIEAAGSFTGPGEMIAGDTRIKAKRFVIATGSSAAVPPIPGLDHVPFLTNETVFDLAERPEHLIVIGGGPIGAELAQAQRRLGARVSLLEMFTVLGKDDPDVTAFARKRLVEDGIEIHEGIAIKEIAQDGNGIAVSIEVDGKPQRIVGSHLLVAAGRRANVNGLNLEAAGVTYSAKGIEVDARLRTTNKKIFAIGDVAGGYQFTHMAGYHAGIVIRNVLFKLPAKVDYKAVPWVTFTDPEIAHVGLTEAQAREQFGDKVRALKWSFEENDRAQAERATEGLVKVVVGARGKILGASIAGLHAGELLQPWVLAISQGMKIGAMANLIAPYPTLGEVNKRAAGSYYTPSLFSERTRKIVRFLQRF
ncbi:FAD-dependent oxidoreductase [Pelagibius litoralis]|uniref:FAD-dependent oxidoreductase n=1 Tax=Pelagibius litoralis TaxID=374515 RepID=A0A967C3V0_9PROT|nr:FAD-dependent oxidoreductase [Pelagibius litoralis]NIA67815.1 FAD-dependent oxidoreductase [Pelagibius litoralis]